MDFNRLVAYELIQEKYLPDISSRAYQVRHKKSGARFLLVENDDENKVFTIAFRTPSQDSTGAAHILEHSVLCGSEKFPLKDPFVELAKGSLNTFLNAITYPDKTMYPIASCNDKDFQNLMHVYMDAVFNPNIYKHEEIFLQEGWSYSLLEEDAELTYNGVVYNEMKGAFSSPEGVLEREICSSLYPDTGYAFESGGNPENIPELSYDKFLEFHKRFYHPANSYVYLYGNMDMEEKLLWLDQEYFSRYDTIQVNSEVLSQKPFKKIREVQREYSITETESETDNTYLSYNIAVAEHGKKDFAKINLAFSVLEYVLISSSGAELKKALLDAGVGKDIYGGYSTDFKQSYFSIIAKNANKEQKDAFFQVIRKTLEGLVKKGIQKDMLEAGINYLEFRYREADFGRFPKGLMYGLQIYESCFYNDDEPFVNLELSSVFAELRDKIETNYFESLVDLYLLKNTHASCVIVEPKKGLTALREEALKEQLKSYKASLSKEEIQKLVKKTEALRSYQNAPSTREALESIPLLQREDIEKKTPKLILEEKQAGNTRVLHHNMNTNGIGYLTFLFLAEDLPQSLLPYAGLLKHVLACVDTEHYSYAALSNEIDKSTGGIQAQLLTYADAENPKAARFTFQLTAKALYNKIPFVFEMAEEILLRSSFADEKRIYEIIAELKSRMQMYLNSSGHVAAAMRGLSYISPVQACSDMTSGLSFYKFIEELEKNYGERKQEIREKLGEVLSRICCREKLLVSYTADEAGYQGVPEQIETLYHALGSKKKEAEKEEFCFEKKNEGFKTSSQVQYVARVGNYLDSGYAYTGALKILSVIMNYEYLWTNIRVKGGAYGCMSGFYRNGDSYFVSYRDPNLEQTNEVFEGIAEFVKEFTVDERDMTKYIIGTMSDVDQPLTPSGKGNRALAAYMTNVSQEMLQKERDEILSAGQDTIRALAPLLEAVMGEDIICAVGNAEKLEASSLFRNKRNLFE